MAALTEGLYPGDIFLYEEDCNRFSRKAITILAGSGSARALTRGMVLGKRAALAATVTPKTGNTGTGVLTMDATTPILSGAKVGRYTVKCTAAAGNAGTMTVYDPSGLVLGTHTVAGAAFANEIKFAVADDVDFVVGDVIYVDVAPTAEKWMQLDPTAVTGEKSAAGILVDDATAADGTDGVGVAVVRHAIVASNKIVWPAGISAGAKANAITQLEAKGILVRDSA